MKTLDLTIIRLLQFMVLVFFTFAVFLWYSFIALVPLAIWINMTEYFAAAFGTALSASLSLVIIGAFVYYTIKIPNLIEAFLATGIDMMKFGGSCIKRIGKIADSVKQYADPAEQQIEVVLKDKVS